MSFKLVEEEVGPCGEDRRVNTLWLSTKPGDRFEVEVQPDGTIVVIVFNNSITSCIPGRVAMAETHMDDGGAVAFLRHQ